MESKENQNGTVSQSRGTELLPYDAANIQNATNSCKENQNGAVSKSHGIGLLPYDVAEIQEATNYSCKSQEQLKSLTDKFKNMGKFGLFCDGKVPNKDWRFYHLFTFSSSNKEEVLAEIEKISEFYEEMTAVTKVISGEDSDENDEKGEKSEKNKKGEKSYQQIQDAYTLILGLREYLTKLHRAAESGVECTNSSAVCNMLNKFIAKHEKLKSLIKQVECVALKQSWQKASEGLEQSRKMIDGLTEKLEKSEVRCNSVCDKFDQLFTMHQETREDNKVLERENDHLQEQQQLLLEQRNQQEEQMQAMERRNGILEQEKEELAGSIPELKAQQKELLQKNTAILDLMKTIVDDIASNKANRPSSPDPDRPDPDLPDPDRPDPDLPDPDLPPTTED